MACVVVVGVEGAVRSLKGSPGLTWETEQREYLKRRMNRELPLGVVPGDLTETSAAILAGCSCERTLFWSTFKAFIIKITTHQTLDASMGSVLPRT